MRRRATAHCVAVADPMPVVDASDWRPEPRPAAWRRVRRDLFEPSGRPLRLSRPTQMTAKSGGA